MEASSLAQAQDGLLLVVAVGAEALHVHAAAQALQQLRLREVGQPAVVDVQLVDQPLQLLRPARVRRHVPRDQADQLLRISLGAKRRIPCHHGATGAAAAFPRTTLITMRIVLVTLSE